MFYSYKGQYPQILPDRFILENGFSLTQLDQLSIEELNSLEFFGPINFPSYSPDTQRLIWTGKEFLVENIIDENNNSNNNQYPYKEFLDVNFLNNFRTTSFYKRIRSEATKKIDINLLYTELLFYINKETIKVVEFVSLCIKFIKTIDFTEEEKNDIFTYIKNSDFSEEFFMFSDEGIENCEYDVEFDRFTDSVRGPFKSWILNDDGNLTPPIEYPNDGKFYKWNEKTISWDLIED